MFSFFKRWRQRRIISRSPIPRPRWQEAVEGLPLLDGMLPGDKNRLIDLAILFLHHKSLEGAHGLAITETMAMTIALQASLPILNLGMDWYSGWISVIVYPAQFVPERTYRDEYGVEHRSRSVLSGEAWQTGPVVLSWEDSEDAGRLDGYNVLIHEFAHKLDVQNGIANGFPPLHKGMDAGQWTQTLSEAYEDLCRRLRAGEAVPINSYATTSPAEFFAVLSEVFFEQPQVLRRYYPAVFDLYTEFYRQDPLGR